MADKRTLRTRKVSERMAVVDVAERGCSRAELSDTAPLRRQQPVHPTLSAAACIQGGAAHAWRSCRRCASLLLPATLASSLLSFPPQVVQARLAALEEDNHREEDFGAGGSDDEEFELPASGDGGLWGRWFEREEGSDGARLPPPTAALLCLLLRRPSSSSLLPCPPARCRGGRGAGQRAQGAEEGQGGGRHAQDARYDCRKDARPQDV
jgi:hypothetical protein